MSEQAIQNEILLRLGALPGLRLWRCNSGLAFGPSGARVKLLPPGHPDLAGVASGGRAVFIEVKAPGQRPRPEQAAFHAMLASLGARVFVASDADACEAEVRAWL